MQNELAYSDVTKCLWLSSSKISKHLDNCLGAIHGIGLTEFMVLQQLVEAPDNALRRIDIADAIARTASGVTRLLAPMEKIGLVTRAANKRDARVSLVAITPQGKQIFDDASQTLEQKSQTLLKGMNQRQATKLLDLLHVI